jgi:hypothetical protein
MIKASDIDESLKKFSDLFKQNQFRKTSPNTYLLPDNIELKVVTDKWGWTAEDGLRFVIRLRNKNLEDSNGNMPYSDGEIDATAKRLIDAGDLDMGQYEEYENSLIGTSLPGSNDWYRVYSSADISNLMTILMPSAIEYAKDWAKKQIDPKHKPSPVKKMSAEQWAKVQGQLSDITKKLS